MAKKINWSEEAIATFSDCLEYLAKDWGEKVVEEYVEKTNEVVKQIAVYPYMFKKYNMYNIREALITKQNILIYKISLKALCVEITFFCFILYLCAQLLT